MSKKEVKHIKIGDYVLVNSEKVHRAKVAIGINGSDEDLLKAYNALGGLLLDKAGGKVQNWDPRYDNQEKTEDQKIPVKKIEINNDK